MATPEDAPQLLPVDEPSTGDQSPPLTLALPEECQRKGWPDRASFRRSANPQDSSLLFRLPQEIRDKIYLELWFLSHPKKGLRYHIWGHPQGKLSRDPCVDLHPHPKRRHDNCATNILTTNPFPCSFLPTLLTCKLMYLDCVSSIYEHTTFVFGGFYTAYRFLGLYHHPSHGDPKTSKCGYEFWPTIHEMEVSSENYPDFNCDDPDMRRLLRFPDPVLDPADLVEQMENMESV